MDFLKETMKAIDESFELEDFMKVPVPNVIKKDAFYFNDKNEGYLETFYNTHDEITKHETNGKIYWTKNIRRNGKVIKKEKFILHRTEDYVLTNRTRLANDTAEDFQTIYEQEFEKRNSPNEPEVHKEFKKLIFDEVTRLIEAHKRKNEFKDQKPHIISLANSFLDFLNVDTRKGKPVPKELEFQFTNNFDSVDEKKVYEYFKSKLVDKGLLSIEDLKDYLKLAFEDEKYPKECFSLKYDYKKDAIGVFFDYYKDVAGKPYGKKEKYVKLLGEYFIGFNNGNLMTNWAKSKY